MTVEIENTGENIRTFKFEGKEVTLNRDGTVGLWYFNWNTGEPPVKLQGAFTNPSKAIEFLTNYLENLPKKKTKE